MSYKTLRAMIEIRLRWSDEIIKGRPHAARGGLWIPDMPAARTRLVEEMDEGNRRHGPLTHWIEERQA